MPQNETQDTLTGDQLRCAAMLADDSLTDEQIAKEIGIDRSTVARWKKQPVFAAKVNEIIDELEKAIIRDGIAQRRVRLSALNQRQKLMMRVIEERAKDSSMKLVPGGTTGLLVRDVKGVGSKDDFKMVEVFSVDTGLLRELREHEKQAAQEIGQWVEKIAPTSPDGTEPFEPITEAERAERLARVLDTARARRGGQNSVGSGEVGTVAGTTEPSGT